jgi:carboxyl-terminal processing protease
MMKKILTMLLLAIVCSSCEQFFLGDDEADTPVNNFELFWNDFDRHYALFHVRHKNWDSVYQVYRPQVNEQTRDSELWNIFSSMIEYLDDSHTVVYHLEDRRAYTSGWALGLKAKEEFNLNLMSGKYVPDLTQVPGEESMYYGKVISKDVGYIFIGAEEGNDPEGAIVKVINHLKTHKAIILDLRNNDGGDARYSKIIAGAFSDGEHLVATVQTRNGPGHDDFNEKVNEVTRLTGKEQFLKPVIVLTDRATISGGEYLALHMRSFAHVTFVGDTTAGDFSAVSLRRFLPNGWTYQYSIQMLLLPDGTSLDGIGIVPDVYIKNTKTDLHNGDDLVLEKALRYLYDEYGIAG